MKKKVILLCVGIAIMLIPAIGFATLIPDVAYDVILPLFYDPIVIVDGNLFITHEGKSTSDQDYYSLFNFDGAKLLSNMQEISFSNNYLIVKIGEYTGVYDRNLNIVVPIIYKAIIMKDATHCVVVDGKKFLRPGSWWGDMFLYDLTTGKIAESLGYGNGYEDMNYESTQKVLSAQWQLEAGGPTGVRISMNGDGWAPIVYCKALNDDGQLLLDFKPYCATWTSAYNRLSYGCEGHFLYGYTGSGATPDEMNYIFTGRGRLLAQQPQGSFFGLPEGQYICVRDGTTSYIMDRDGNTVIPKGMFDNYIFNATDSGSRTIISDVDAHIIVSKNEKYGIITLPTIRLSPSEWAKPEVTKAINEGLVPEDIQLWWKDCCTREEFCRMLSLSAKRITGKTLATLAVGMQELSFSDCNNPDVLAASALGIVNGMGKGLFAPNKFITREQAAAMLARAATVFDIFGTGIPVSFADEDQISDWAQFGVDTVSSIYCGTAKTSLMQGVGNNLFSPQAYYTVEQSAITVMRLGEAVK